MTAQIDIEHNLRSFVYLAGVEIIGVHVHEAASHLEDELRVTTQALREKYASPAEALPIFEPVRRMYRAVKIDPTQVRPSSEALIRRLLQGKDLYRINSVVDCFNLLSIRFALPVGLYDMTKIKSPIRLRLGETGEGYVGIRKEQINVAGRYCLADADGPFGNPSSDSARAAITEETQEILAVFFVPREIPPAVASACLQETQMLFKNWHPAAQSREFIIDAEEKKLAK